MRSIVFRMGDSFRHEAGKVDFPFRNRNTPVMVGVFPVVVDIVERTVTT